MLYKNNLLVINNLLEIKVKNQKLIEKNARVIVWF